MFMFTKKHKNMKQKNRVTIIRHRIIQATSLFCLIVLASSGFITIKNVHAQSLQDQIEDLRQENQQNLSNVEKLRDVATSYEDAINTLEHDIEETERAISVSQTRQAELEKKIEQAKAELEKQKGLLSDNIRAMYIEGDITTLEMLASSNDLSEFVDKQQYRESIKNQISTTVERVNALQKELAEQKKQVEVELATQTDSRARLAQSRREQSRLLALNESEQASFNRQTEKNKEKIKELEEAQAALQRRLSSGNFVSQGPVKRGDVLGTVGNTGVSFGKHLHLEARYPSGDVFNPAPLINSGQWLRPVEGGYVSQAFGERSSIYYRGYHPGIDYAGVPDRPIRAVADGEIVSRGWVTFGTTAYGYAVVIRHADGIFSVYGHMNPPS